MNVKKQRSSAFNTRQYMLSRDYELYYYSDLHFQSVGVHSHDYYEFYFFEEGAVTMEIGDRRYPLKRGDVILVPPGVMHRAHLTDPGVPYRRFVFWLSRAYASALAAQTADLAPLFSQADDEGRFHRHFDLLTFNALRATLFALLDELRADRFGKNAQIDLYVRQLLLSLSRLAHEQDSGRARPDEVSRYGAVAGYIDTHLEADLTLERLAREFYLSKFYIAHLFRKNIGLSVHQYLIKKRLAACRDAIQSGSKISEVYIAYGFRDYSSFYRAFRKEYGTSPSAYRRIGSKDPAP